MFTAINVKQSRTSVIYYFMVGSLVKEVTKKGGSLSWRCNNPGNLRSSTKEIGAYRNDNGRYAIFADGYAGLKALVDLLKSDTYAGLTVAEVIAKYAPSHDGNPVSSYTKSVCKAAGCAETDLLHLLDEIKFNRIVQSIIDFEGYEVGSTVTKEMPIEEFKHAK